jgi:hypothetical protein
VGTVEGQHVLFSLELGEQTDAYPLPLSAGRKKECAQLLLNCFVMRKPHKVRVSKELDWPGARSEFLSFCSFDILW